MIKPKLKSYFRVLEANLEDKENISIVIGSSPSTARELEGEISLLTLISLCDGNNNLDYIVEAMNEEYRISRPEVIAGLKHLENEGILEENNTKSEQLTNEELDRYSRHLVYYSSFTNHKFAPQEILKNSTVTLIGMGGIGNWLSLNLVAAGVGNVRGVDNDDIELSNLTRQILFSEADLGTLKVDKAKEKLESLNSSVKFEAIPKKMTSVDSVKDVIEGSDIVILSADSPEHIHYWVDEACYDLKIPWTNVGYVDTWGVCGPIVVPDKTSCLICDMKTREVKEDSLHKNKNIFNINKRTQAPSFGPVNGLISCFAALETIKFLTRYEAPITLGKRWTFDSGTMEIEMIDYPKDETCIQCGH